MDKRDPIIIDADDPEAPQKLSDALGLEPGDSVEIITPQFHRTPDMAPPPGLPATDDEWRQLASMSIVEARERGFGSWDGGLFLLPGEWYRHIPPWLNVECISGEKSAWGEEERDSDIRFGFLPYGVRLGPSSDEES
jgi:hypothetical protein